MYTFKLDSKEQCKAVKWVQLAASKDKARAILNGLYINNGETAASDGFRMHIIETPDALTQFTSKVIQPVSTVTVTPQIQEVTEIEGTFPDYNQIVPTKEPVFQIRINPAYLAGLKDMPGEEEGVLLSFTAHNEPVKVTKGDSVAVIMPMQLEK